MMMIVFAQVKTSVHVNARDVATTHSFFTQTQISLSLSVRERS
jgi:hypothetical protein